MFVLCKEQISILSIQNSVLRPESFSLILAQFILDILHTEMRDQFRNSSVLYMVETIFLAVSRLIFALKSGSRLFDEAQVTGRIDQF